VFTANLITYNHLRKPCRLQYTFYRASFLKVINIHRGIKVHDTGATRATDTGTLRQIPEPLDWQPLEPLEQQPLEPLERQPLESIKRQPQELIERQLLEPLERQPLESIEQHQPPALIEQQPLEPLERQAPEPINSTGATGTTATEPLEQQPPESIEQQPPQEQQILEPTRVSYRNCWSCGWQIVLEPQDQQWSRCEERQILLELCATDTGAYKQPILLELQVTDTGATGVRLRGSTDTGALSDIYWICKPRILGQPIPEPRSATASPQTLEPEPLDWLLLLEPQEQQQSVTTTGSNTGPTDRKYRCSINSR